MMKPALLWMLLPVLALAAWAAPGDRVREMVMSMPSAYNDHWIDLRTDQPADAQRWLKGCATPTGGRIFVPGKKNTPRHQASEFARGET